jgi:hypothetical protein
MFQERGALAVCGLLAVGAAAVALSTMGARRAERTEMLEFSRRQMSLAPVSSLAMGYKDLLDQEIPVSGRLVFAQAGFVWLRILACSILSRMCVCEIFQRGLQPLACVHVKATMSLKMNMKHIRVYVYTDDILPRPYPESMLVNVRATCAHSQTLASVPTMKIHTQFLTPFCCSRWQMSLRGNGGS